MPDPWTDPGRPNALRFVCPFEDWWYDEPDDYWPDEIPADATAGATTFEEARNAAVVAQLSAKNQRIDRVIREHLESHSLEDWFAAAVKLQRIQYAARSVVGWAPPPAEEIDAALCAGVITVNTARWIQQAREVVAAAAAGSSLRPQN